MAHGRYGGCSLAVLELAQSFSCDSTRQLGVDLTGLGADADRETTLPQQFEHAVVLRFDDCFKQFNPGCRRSLAELTEQDRTEAAALVLVRHRQCELGFAWAN